MHDSLLVHLFYATCGNWSELLQFFSRYRSLRQLVFLECIRSELCSRGNDPERNTILRTIFNAHVVNDPEFV